MTEQQEQGHWIDNDNFRKQFWGDAKNRFGLSNDDVHRILKVDSVRDFQGTYAEAVTILKGAVEGTPPAEPAPAPPPQSGPAQANSELFEHCAQLPEAPALAWTKFISQSGFVWSVTVRSGLPNGLAMESLRSIKEQIQLFEKGAKAYAWVPYANGNGGPVVRPATSSQSQPTSATAPPPPPSGSGVPPAPPQAQGGNGQAQVEHIDYILVTAPKGNPQVEFWREGRQYPELKWNLGGAKLLEISPALVAQSWTAEHFDTVGARYAMPFVVHWEPSPKNPKWKDVLRVEPGN